MLHTPQTQQRDVNTPCQTSIIINYEEICQPLFWSHGGYLHDEDFIQSYYSHSLAPVHIQLELGGIKHNFKISNLEWN